MSIKGVCFPGIILELPQKFGVLSISSPVQGNSDVHNDLPAFGSVYSAESRKMDYCQKTINIPWKMGDFGVHFH